MTEKQKLTPWFASDVMPAREGMYEINLMPVVGLERPRRWARWENGHWHLALTEFSLARHAESRSVDLYLNDGRFIGWRGLAEPPK